MKIGIIVAMSSELACVQQLLRNKQEERYGNDIFYIGTTDNHQIILTQSGIGKVNAALRAQILIQRYCPDYIINTGVAGGIDASVQVMDMVIGSETVYHDAWFGEGNVMGQIQGLPPRFRADADLLQKIKTVVSDSKNIYCGLICSGDQFITDRTEMEKIKRNFPDGLAVDMESAAIAQTCCLHNTPFVSMRIISDTPGVENHFAQYLNFWDEAPEYSFTILKKIIDSL